MAKAYLRQDSPLVWITFSHKEKRYRKKTNYEANKKNLEIVQKEVIPVLMHKIKTGEVILEKQETKNFEYYSNLFVNSKSILKQNSIRKYTRHGNLWCRIFGDKEIDKIKASEIKKALFDMNIKVITQKGYLQSIANIFEEAILDEIITINPALKIKLPKAKRVDIIPFDKEEVNKILTCAHGFFKNYVAIGFYTGCRTGEILAMKWQNVDFENQRIWIDATVGDYDECSTKTGKSRFVPIFDSLILYLREQEKRTGLGTYVFCTKNGTPYSSSNLYTHSWMPLLKRAKVPRRRLYDTRHTFATNMLESGKFSLNQIASWLGHANIQTLIQNYNKYIPSELAKYDTNIDVFVTNSVTGKNEGSIKAYK